MPSSFCAGDLEQLRAHGITMEEVERQLNLLRHPPPPLALDRPARVGDGILILSEARRRELEERGAREARRGRVSRFVPASGAASRMFQAPFAWLARGGENLNLGEVVRAAEAGDGEAAQVREILERCGDFAFAEAWDGALRRGSGKGLEASLREGAAGRMLAALLSPSGLALGGKPKGLIPFHRYPDHVRTPLEEQLVEAALTGRSEEGCCRIHFTVSAAHADEFQRRLEEVRRGLEARWETRCEVSFSHQAPSTDTVAVDGEGNLFRRKEGSLLLRPGGHGALLGNLEGTGADLLFVKNIDNVVPDWGKPETVRWKKILLGLLAEIQEALQGFLRRIRTGEGAEEEALKYLETRLFLAAPPQARRGREAACRWLLDRLDRPLRVCGVVENTGEPGGGPFWVRGKDGEVSLQIVESAQIGVGEEARRVFASSTHFNPVDLVLALRDADGRPYELSRFVDEEAVFLSRKFQEGRELRALERPGLWNGAMAGWNTLFVEVPLSTFNPVKTVNDLLRPAHQPALEERSARGGV